MRHSPFHTPRAIYGLPAKLSARIYTKLELQILELAAKPGGVSRRELMTKFGLSLYQTNKFIKFYRMPIIYNLGRTDFFTVPSDFSKYVKHQNTSEGKLNSLRYEIEHLETLIKEKAKKLLILKLSYLNQTMQNQLEEEDPYTEWALAIQSHSVEAILGDEAYGRLKREKQKH